MKRTRLSLVPLAIGLALCLTLAFGAAKVQKKVENTDPALRVKAFEQHRAMVAQTPFKDLRWRFIGPFDLGGRCTDIAVPKGSRTVFYAGAATGGVFKTENAGTTWEPLFDDQPTLSIGDIAVAESDANIVYVGTGEANIFRASEAGIGIFKSTDAGQTWTRMGLEGTYTIGRVVIHPTNPEIVYVAAPGHEWTNNPERGVFKTTDGGKTWQKVLFVNDHVGANDLVMDPQNPDTLYAATWNRIRLRWSDPRPGGEDGLFKTTDAGQTWKPINNGLPDTNFTGRIGIDLCRTKPNVLYAYVDNHSPGREPRPGELDSYGRPRQRGIVGAEVYRTDDGGESWRKVSPTDERMERFGGTYGWVFSQIRVDPNDAETIYIMGLGLSKSTDGGKSYTNLYYEGLHGDHHGLWIDPFDSSHLINTNDGGVNISYDGGKTWRDFHAGIPAVQFYNVAYDFQSPFWVYGSVQDQGTYRGWIPLRKPGQASQAPQRRRMREPLPRWETAPGGEGTIIAVDPEDPNTIYSSSFYGRLERSEYKNGAWTSKQIFPRAAEGEPAYRGQWLAATMISPHNPRIIYHGFQYLFRSLNRGETWEKISPDLTYNNPQQQGVWPYGIPFATITAVDESPFKFGLLYVGTDDGRVWVTRNGGESWTEITAGLPFNKHTWAIVASRYDRATVYVTLVGRHDDDFNPYIFKSADYGKTWTSIAGNIPGGPVNVVREDPKTKGVLYAGTDTGVYVSLDDGKTWAVLGSGLPTSYVWDLAVHPRDNALIIATNGRGMWLIDDLAAVQSAVAK
ncbi:MAG: hypothetical protein OEW05_11875 [Candidatus Aminicenantes bacterium]|nr:hypothetical protein [Candidatus Aminicenantes bacterium]